MVRAFAHGAMGRRIDPTWGGPIELFLVPSGARCSSVVRWVVGSILHGADPLSYFSFHPERDVAPW